MKKGLHEDLTLPFEQPFELYHNALSLCSMKVRLCLAELQIDYKSHHIDLIETGSYENISRDFRRINPGRTVPLLVHNGHRVYESHEQIRYAAKHAGSEAALLVPADPHSRTLMEHWIDNSSLTGDPLKESHLSAGNAVPGQTLPLFTTMIEKIPYHRIAVGFLFHFDKRRPALFTLMKLFGLKVLHRLPPLRKLVEESRQNLHMFMDQLESQLRDTGGPWILGEQFTLADVSWLVILERLRQVDALDVFASPVARPACRAWWTACTGRPSYHKAITAHEHPITLYGTRRLQELKAADPAVRELLEGPPRV